MSRRLRLALGVLVLLGLILVGACARSVEVAREQALQLAIKRWWGFRK